MTPQPSAGQAVRYVAGRPTIFADGQNGSIQVTPHDPNEKGRLTYSVAALNQSQTPVNFGVENLTLSADGMPVRIFTVPELERMAKNDAAMAAVALAVVGGVAAAAAASGPTSTSTYTTPRGTYTYQHTNHLAQSLAVASVTAGTTASIASVGATLDATLAQMGAQNLQTTTIDPGESYGGMVVGDRVTIPDDGPLNTSLRINFAGEDYVVNFAISTQQ